MLVCFYLVGDGCCSDFWILIALWCILFFYLSLFVYVSFWFGFVCGTCLVSCVCCIVCCDFLGFVLMDYVVE